LDKVSFLEIVGLIASILTVLSICWGVLSLKKENYKLAVVNIKLFSALIINFFKKFNNIFGLLYIIIGVLLLFILGASLSSNSIFAHSLVSVSGASSICQSGGNCYWPIGAGHQVYIPIKINFDSLVSVKIGYQSNFSQKINVGVGYLGNYSDYEKYVAPTDGFGDLVLISNSEQQELCNTCFNGRLSKFFGVLGSPFFLRITMSQNAQISYVEIKNKHGSNIYRILWYFLAFVLMIIGLLLLFRVIKL